MNLELDWLPQRADWQQALDEAKLLEHPAALEHYRSAGQHPDGLCANGEAGSRRAEVFGAWRRAGGWTYRGAPGAAGSSTLTHLVPGIRVAGLRRGLLIEVYEAPYGTYRQELTDPASGLHAFRPTVVLTWHSTHGTWLEWEASRTRWKRCAHAGGWRARRLPVRWFSRQCYRYFRRCSATRSIGFRISDILGRPDQCRSARRRMRMASLCWRWMHLRATTDSAGGTMPDYGIAPSRRCIQLRRHCMASRWRGCWLRCWDRAEVPGARSRQHAVGRRDRRRRAGRYRARPGQRAGEAYLRVSTLCESLCERGVVLAVCSKNDEANALLPFEQHPEMVLRRADIACFVANWDDKATNLRAIARALNLGLDALVFVDDNPAERGFVRRELPMVAVPEMPEDPAEYVRVLAAAGYFEGVGVTARGPPARCAVRGECAARSGRTAATEGAATDLAELSRRAADGVAWRPSTGWARADRATHQQDQPVQPDHAARVDEEIARRRRGPIARAAVPAEGYLWRQRDDRRGVV